MPSLRSPRVRRPVGVVVVKLAWALAAALLLAGCAAEDGEGGPEADAPGDAPAGSDPHEGTTDREDAPSGSQEGAPSGTSGTPGGATSGGNATKPTPTRPTPPRVSGDDLDGIPDALERSLATRCEIVGRSCADLGIEPPEPGYRDYVLVQVSRPGADQAWRLPQGVWDAFHEEVAQHGWRVQVADLGLRADVDVRKTWDDGANEGRFWFAWMTYDAASPDTAGTNHYNWINMHLESDETELLQTLLHEVYHSVLGDLRAQQSRCPQEEVGGPGHSDDPASILYVPEDCDTEKVTSIKLGSGELAEMREEPFENLRLMNEAGFTSSAHEDAPAGGHVHSG